MFELLKSLVFAVVMVPVVMAVILGLIYGLGEVFNVISKTVTRKNGIPFVLECCCTLISTSTQVSDF